MTACLGCRAGAGAPADQGAVRDGKQGEWQFSATAQYVKSGGRGGRGEFANSPRFLLKLRQKVRPHS